MNKKQLILLPGVLCDRALWAPQLEGLADIAEMTVVDLAGHESMKALADAVLAQAPERFALAGLSMGGYVALEIMHHAPERVSRLALLGTSARPDAPERTADRLALLELAKMGKFKGVTRRLLPTLVHESRLDDVALTTAVMAMTERVGRNTYLRQQKAVMGRRDFRPDLPGITCPTMVLCGRQDRRRPLAQSEEMADLIPGARLVVVEECGHLSTMEHPKAVNAAMRAWLRD